MRRDAGFTLVEMMIVVVVIGILAAVAIPNFVAMQVRAREAGTKANMHTFQLAAEDHAVMNDGAYAADASAVVSLVPGGDGNFRNSFSGTGGMGVAWENRSSMDASASTIPGITSYSDSNAYTYNVKGFGKATAILIVLTSGR
jgi:prepilin-type N-terminal cleavage/methylation domain-containing protein